MVKLVSWHTNGCFNKTVSSKEVPQLTEEEQTNFDKLPPVVSALLYLSMNTRPDIICAVDVLSQHGAQNHKKE